MSHDPARPPMPSTDAPPPRGRVWFVTRHPGAVEWARRQGLRIDQRIDHLDPEQIQPGDIVIGILPVNLAGEVCARQARFFNLSLDLPAEARGRELSADDMERYRARLEEYWVEKRAAAPGSQPAT